MKAILASAIILLGLTLFPVSGVHAANNPEGRSPNNLFPPAEEAESETAISRRQASDLARQNFPGNVLSVRMENGRWRVRMDQDGTVFNVFVDAESGRVSRASSDQE